MILKASKTLDIRFSEVDSMNVVWHGSYPLYFEDARELFGQKYDLTYMGFFDHGFFLFLFNSYLYLCGYQCFSVACYVGCRQCHAENLLLHVDGCDDGLSHTWQFENMEVSDGPDESNLYSFFQDVLVDIAYSCGTCLSDVLNQTAGTKATVVGKDALLADGCLSDCTRRVKECQLVNHDKRFLLG